MPKISLKTKILKNYEKVEREGWTILIKTDFNRVLMQPFFATRKEAREYKYKNYIIGKIVKMKHIQSMSWK